MQSTKQCGDTPSSKPINLTSILIKIIIIIKNKIDELKDTTKSKGERPREQRGGFPDRLVVTDHLLLTRHEIRQVGQRLGEDSRHVAIAMTAARGRRGVVDVGAGVDAGGDHDDMVELVEQEDRVQKREHLQITSQQQNKNPKSDCQGGGAKTGYLWAGGWLVTWLRKWENKREEELAVAALDQKKGLVSRRTTSRLTSSV